MPLSQSIGIAHASNPFGALECSRDPVLEGQAGIRAEASDVLPCDHDHESRELLRAIDAGLRHFVTIGTVSQASGISMLEIAGCPIWFAWPARCRLEIAV